MTVPKIANAGPGDIAVGIVGAAAEAADSCGEHDE
jgi:hypothetical protein